MCVRMIDHVLPDQLLEAKCQHLLRRLDPVIATGVKKSHEPVTKPQGTTADVKYARRGNHAFAEQHFESRPAHALKIARRSTQERSLAKAFRSRLQ